MKNIKITFGFKRANKGPLESDTLFSSYEDALSYSKSKTAYSGQVITVFIESTGEITRYLIDKSMELVPIDQAHIDLVELTGSGQFTKKFEGSNYPEFQVLDSELNEVDVRKSYLSPDTIKVDWSGDLTGKILVRY